MKISDLIVGAINLYQKTISPDHGIFFFGILGKCRYYPTCSEYTKESIKKSGVIKGAILGLKRLLSCNPWTKQAFNHE